MGRPRDGPPTIVILDGASKGRIFDGLGAASAAFAVAGSEAWTDYAVSADARFLSKSSAVLMGRIDSANVLEDGKARWPSGYIFRVGPDGAWELFSAAYGQPLAPLASGKEEIVIQRWHHLSLRLRNNTIEAILDDKSLASVMNAAHTHGMFALGTEWDHVQFDNARVTR